MPKAATNDPVFVQLRKWHLVVAMMVGIAVPIVSLIAGYYSKESAVKDIENKITLELSSYKLESEKRFVKKDEFSSMKEKLDRIADDLSTIKGYLRRERRSNGK